MTTITKPGVYLDFDIAAYHDDPCPAPSLNQSTAKTILRAPARAWVQHPRLNPQFKRVEQKKFDVGNIAHELLLGRGKGFIVIEGDDWAKDRKEKTERREAAARNGLIGILSRDYDLATNMVVAAREQLAARGYQKSFSHNPALGSSEVVVAAMETDEAGREWWLRTMIDWYDGDVWDYKTTARSAAPDSIDYRMVEQGWDVQHAMIERCLNLIDPSGAGRRIHRCLVQELEEPYLINVVRFYEDTLTMGRKKLDAGVALWRQAMISGQWGGYPLADHRATYPGSAEKRWLDREDDEAASGQPERGNMLPSLMGG